MPDPTPDDRRADERWLEVLAGRAEPVDAPTRRAAKVREHYEERAERDALTPVDPKRLDRLLAVMEAYSDHGARPPATTGASRPHVPATEAAASAGTGTSAGNDGGSGGGSSRGWLEAMRLWLFPPQGGSAWRLGAVAAGLMGVAVVLRMLPGTEEDGHLVPKTAPQSVPMPMSRNATPPSVSTPPSPNAAPSSAQPMAAPGLLVITDSRPMERAIQIRTALQRLGLQPQVTPTASGAMLQAAVPPDRSAEVQIELNRLGLYWPRADYVQVEFRTGP